MEPTSKIVPDPSASLSGTLERPAAGEDPTRLFEKRLLLVAKSGAAGFAGKLFVTGIRFVTALVLARALGPTEYGQYNLALTVATFTSAFALLGFDVGIVRFLAAALTRGDTLRVHQVLRLGFLLPMAAAVLAAFVIVIAAEPLTRILFDNPQLTPLVRLSGLLVPVIVWNTMGEAALRGFKQQTTAVGVTSFFQSTVRLGLVVVLALTRANAVSALLAFLFASSATAAFFWALLRKQLAVRVARSKVLARELLVFSLPVYGSDLLEVLSASVPTFLLGISNPVSSVGVFAIAMQLTVIGQFFHSAFVTASMPIVSEFNERGARAELGRLYRAISKWSFTLNLPLFFILVLFPSQLLSLFGASFAVGSTALTILAWSTLVNTGTGISGVMLVMTGHTRLELLNTLLSTAVLIAASVLFIPPYGLNGAAVALLGASLTLNFLRLVQTYRLFHLLPYDAQFLKPLAAGGASLLAVSALLVRYPATNTQALVLYASLIVGIYAAVLMALGISAEDRIVLARLKIIAPSRDTRA